MEAAHKILEAKSTEFGPLGREQIKQLCEAGLIKPFVSEKVRKKDGKPIPSYGLSEAGYDIRLGYSFLVPHGAMDVANPHYDGLVLEDDDTLWLDGNSFVLGESVETFDLPPDIRITAFSKSTWLRAGVVAPISPLEPGWCFDDKTEILTLNGWKHFEELTGQELVATIDDAGVLIYAPIAARQRYWYDGEMISIQGRSIDLLVTPEHQLYVRKRWGKNFEFLRADTIENNDLEFKRDAIWKGEEPQYFTLDSELNGIQKTTRAIAEQVIAILKKASAPLLSDELYQQLRTPKPARRTFDRLMAILTKEKVVERIVVHLSGDRRVGASHFWQYRLLKERHDFGLLPPIRIPMTDWVKFFGLWLAEGSAFVNKGDYVIKVAVLTDENLPKIKEILQALPFHWNKIKSGFITVNKQLCKYLMQFGHAHEKFIPPEIKRLSPRLLRLFLSGYMLGDGNAETNTATTSSKRLVDDLQEIGLKIGIPASYWLHQTKATPVHCNERYTSNYNTYKIRFSKYGTPRWGRGEKPWSKVPYEGYVYDVTVPPYHTIYVRRNGKAVWSGNCGKLTIEIFNAGKNRVRLYPGVGIAQLVFELIPVGTGYKGPYQLQAGVTGSLLRPDRWD